MHSATAPSHVAPGVAISTSSSATTCSSSFAASRTADSKSELMFKSSQENLSDEETASSEGVSDEEVWAPMPVRGTLSKWTNLLHGWQERFFVLSDGMLTYYRNADEVGLGSRGAVRVRLAYVKAHEYDDCRFEVRVGESIWYLRGLSASQRDSWMSAIERHRVAESGYGSQKTLHRPSSSLSLNSGHSPSIASTSSFKRSRRLREKLAEMETFKDLLCKQVDSLQTYFDACCAIIQHISPDMQTDRFKEDTGQSTDASTSAADDRDREAAHRMGRRRWSREDTGLAHLDDLIETSPECSPRAYVSSPASGFDASLLHGQFGPDDEARVVHSSSSDAMHTPKAERRSATDGNVTNTAASAVSGGGGGGGGFFSRFLPFRSSGGSWFSQSPTRTTAAKRSDSPRCTPDVSAHQSALVQLCDLKTILKQHGVYAMDFRGESHMFKATAAGILTNLSHTIELMQQNEEQWRRRFEREVERKRRLEETQRAMAQELAQLRQLSGMGVTFSTAPGASSHHHHAGARHSHGRVPSCGSIDLHSAVQEPVAAVAAAFDTKHDQHAPPASSRYGLAGPDMEEGPNSPIREEEFYDAIDAESDRIEQDDLRLAALKSAGELLRSAQAMPTTHPLYAELEKAVVERIRNFANPQAFFPPGQRVSRSAADLSESAGAGNAKWSATAAAAGGATRDTSDDWQVIAQDGDMVIYQREVETDDGLVLDPLQAVHVVPGVTAREMCSYFWDVRYRMDWEFTIDQAPTVLEVCGDDTVVLHQVYKRVWPTTQRDSVFWSHIRQVSTRFPLYDPNDNGPTGDATRTHHRSLSVDSWTRAPGDKSRPGVSFDSSGCLPALLRQTGLHAAPSDDDGDDSDGVLDSWMVVNMSTNYQAQRVAPSASPMIRLGLDVVLYCQTMLTPSAGPGSSTASLFSRDRLRTRLVYMANINPGGWVPVAGLRTLARREYPRFLKRFSAYVQEQTREKRPMF